VNEAGIEDMDQSRLSHPQLQVDLVKVPEGKHDAQHDDRNDCHEIVHWLTSSKALVHTPGNKGLVATHVWGNPAMQTKEAQLYQ